MSLCLVAGAGRLPAAVLAARPEAMVLAVAGVATQDIAVDRIVRLETLGSVRRDLVRRGVREICFAGGMRRPRINPARIDAATLPLVPRMMGALGQGDDAALRILAGLFEEVGIAVRGAHEVVPDLLPPAGVLGRVAPGKRDRSDADRGLAVLMAMGGADMGQGCVVSGGQVLVAETMPGTDWMLATLAAGRGAGDLATRLPQGGVLVKAPKPGQDRRMDLPAIGPETVAAALRAGLHGIAVAAEGVMVLDRDAVREAADRAGLFLWVRA